MLDLKTASKSAEIWGTILSYVCLDSLPAITNIIDDHLCYAIAIKLYNQNHLTLLSVRLLTLYSALYLPLPLLLLWLVLTLLYTKEGFFLCHTRYTNTTFSLSVSVQTLPFCQAHRSTTPTADVPFRGSKTYSCTGWTE